jgi:protein-disulfide isomerase
MVDGRFEPDERPVSGAGDGGTIVTATPGVGEPVPARTLPAVTAGDRTDGAATAAVTLVVYGNYSCLHCRRAYVELDDLVREAGDGLRVVYRHFARAADFPDAERAAEAACAAAAQGRFRDMHLRLSTGAPFFDESALMSQAADLGLDVVRFAAELHAGRYRARVQGEHADGAAAGVVATPTFYLEGEYFAERWDLDALRVAVLAAIERDAGRRD